MHRILAENVAIITGASRGLGQYYGRALAKAGADLVVTGCNLDSLMSFKSEIEDWVEWFLLLNLYR